MGSIEDFYSGYEGEPEIYFIHKLPDGKAFIIKSWVGYFDSIMSAIQPTINGWEGLSYYYHNDQGWYEECPWDIPNIEIVLEEFKRIDINTLEVETLRLYECLVSMFLSTKTLKGTISIEYF